MTDDRILLLGCGILRKEVAFLIRKNKWPVATLFLDSALHVDFDKLAKALAAALSGHRHEKTVVFYGACHPLMDEMLSEAGTFRVRGQNCCEMLLGHELFAEELANGAFFLLEDWARRWEHIMTRTFHTANLEIIRDIFREDRKYILGVRTPCSDDFTAEAEAAGQMVDLPVRWLDVSLNHLEAVLREAIMHRMREKK